MSNDWIWMNLASLNEFPFPKYCLPNGDVYTNALTNHNSYAFCMRGYFFTTGSIDRVKLPPTCKWPGSSSRTCVSNCRSSPGQEVTADSFQHFWIVVCLLKVLDFFIILLNKMHTCRSPSKQPRHWWTVVCYPQCNMCFSRLKLVKPIMRCHEKLWLLPGIIWIVSTQRPFLLFMVLWKPWRRHLAKISDKNRGTESSHCPMSQMLFSEHFNGVHSWNMNTTQWKWNVLPNQTLVMLQPLKFDQICLQQISSRATKTVYLSWFLDILSTYLRPIYEYRSIYPFIHCNPLTWNHHFNVSQLCSPISNTKREEYYLRKQFHYSQ